MHARMLVGMYATRSLSRVQVFLGIFRFFGVFFGFMCVDVAKTARVTRMRLMPKL